MALTKTTAAAVITVSRAREGTSKLQLIQADLPRRFEIDHVREIVGLSTVNARRLLHAMHVQYGVLEKVREGKRSTYFYSFKSAKRLRNEGLLPS